ncbi:hypothetical protein M427DRAFT_419479 [Gonapodya prolifera JEL478]|uniref:Uncharacterized protein n=1 Tax=Gonapodya prolifera (strain JEL478) TaxID=1344416 RepID=A0A139A4V5_GONPJ|nr:hypothetical protein M427DRAFT_419479 [Gonapodya prolifera JEL478]|eukprot:KXS11774.1 hypothetical protein M427DRAFT_419479 [Gonapodya prolifera JEL478]
MCTPTRACLACVALLSKSPTVLEAHSPRQNLRKRKAHSAFQPSGPNLRFHLLPIRVPNQPRELSINRPNHLQRIPDTQTLATSWTMNSGWTELPLLFSRARWQSQGGDSRPDFIAACPLRGFPRSECFFLPNASSS